MRRTTPEDLRPTMAVWFSGASDEAIDLACRISAKISDDPAVPSNARLDTLMSRLYEISVEHAVQHGVDSPSPVSELIRVMNKAIDADVDEFAEMLEAIRNWDRETAHYYSVTPRLQVTFDACLEEPLHFAHNNDAELGEIPITPRQAANLARIMTAYNEAVGDDE